MNNSYNPGWKSDQELLDGFIARHDLFDFLRDELARAPLYGNVQHYLLVGMRGAGKTTMLRRLAVAMRHDQDLSDHLIPLSFPEELYQVKNLADFWWAACEALYEALNETGREDVAQELDIRIENRENDIQQPNSDVALILLQKICTLIKRRPVLLIDNLDFVLQRIDKKGRKLNDPQAPAYWSMREALSTMEAPMVIGGSVRLTSAFIEYDNVFYDFFVPKRLGKLTLPEVKSILVHLADAYNTADLKRRLSARPGRVQAIYEMTGGNPRAINLVVDIFQKSIDSRAVDDFARLMDLSTPYYKARFEDLPEQAQVVLHALALAKKPEIKGNGFGYTAAAVAKQAGLETRTVSAQMEVLVEEGAVEKIGGKGRTQYRVAEQLFRLWMQMRSTRRIRANVQGLVDFLEEMFDEEELRSLPAESVRNGATPLNLATWAFARSEMGSNYTQKYALAAHAADQLLLHTEKTNEQLAEFFGPEDLPSPVALASKYRERLQKCKTWRAKVKQEDVAEILKIPGSIKFTQQQKDAAIDLVCMEESTPQQLKEIISQIALERATLKAENLSATDIDLLYKQRAQANFSIPDLVPSALESIVGIDSAMRLLAWKLLISKIISTDSVEIASDWLDWAILHIDGVAIREWQKLAQKFSKLTHYEIAEKTFRHAIEIDPANPILWSHMGIVFSVSKQHEKAAEAYQKSLDLDPSSAVVWRYLGDSLSTLGRFNEAIIPYQKSVELDPKDADTWNHLAVAFAKEKNFGAGEISVRKAIELDSRHVAAWNNLGLILSELNKLDKAEEAFRQAIDIDINSPAPWTNIMQLLVRLKRYDDVLLITEPALERTPAVPDIWFYRGKALNGLLKFNEAEISFRKTIEMSPENAAAWGNLGNSLVRQKRYSEAEDAFRTLIAIDPINPAGFGILGAVLALQDRHEEAEEFFRESIKLDPSDAAAWNNLAGSLFYLKRYEETELAYIKAIDLDPENRDRVTRLVDFRNHQALEKAIFSSTEMNWKELGHNLLPLMQEDRRPARWQVSSIFIERLVIPALRKKQGAPLLHLLREIGFEKTAAPLVLALEASISNDPERLNSVEPELRTAALKMYERLN